MPAEGLLRHAGGQAERVGLALLRRRDSRGVALFKQAADVAVELVQQGLQFFIDVVGLRQVGVQAFQVGLQVRCIVVQHVVLVLLGEICIQVQLFHFGARPRRLAQELQARFDAGVA